MVLNDVKKYKMAGVQYKNSKSKIKADDIERDS